MFVLGVTGEFGSGKSTVAKMLGRKGCKVIDADALAHEIFAKDASCRRKVKAAFGEDVLTPQGVDRRKLGAKVFRDPRSLKKLESIIHPLIKMRILKELKKSRFRFVVLDVPLLIEAGWTGMVDALIVVKACRKLEIERIEKRMGLSRAEIMRRIKRQMPVREKLGFADLVIDNRGSLADTDKQVEKIWNSLPHKTHQKRKLL